MTQLSRGKRFSLAIQLASLASQLFLKGNNKAKASVIAEQIAGIGEVVLDDLTPPN